MELFNALAIDIGYVVIGLFGCVIILFIMVIIMMSKNKKLEKKYKKFMTGSGGRSLEKEVAAKFKKIGNLTEKVEKLTERVEFVDEKLAESYQKLGLIKYDAFNEMGGKLSFALCLLTEGNNGFIINSMHSKDGCYTYVKEIIKGESFVLLADEEREALNQATGINNI